MVKRPTFATIAIGAAAALGGLPAHAHDAKGLIVQEMQSATVALSTALAATPTADERTRSVLNNLRLWPVPRRLTICFTAGDGTVRRKVTDTARRLWPLATLTEGRLDFDSDTFTTVPDCGPNPTADIRVAFQNGSGYWSYVGVESRAHVPSMNFGGFTATSPSDAEFERVVAHEMGHALGLEHEHQSPAAPKDCGWNFDYIRKAYQWDSDEDMHHNFDKLQDYLQNGRHAYVFSTYDQRSLMHYAFETQAFKDGDKSPCFIAQNKVPSDQDKNAMRVAYGPNIVSAQEAVRGAIPQLGTLFPGAEYKRLHDLATVKAATLGQ